MCQQNFPLSKSKSETNINREKLIPTFRLFLSPGILLSFHALIHYEIYEISTKHLHEIMKREMKKRTKDLL